jgi:hypothetical protein
MPSELPTTESGIDAFLAAFESGTLPKARWTHAAHLLTGACYVHALGEAAAIARMRERVSAYNIAVGGRNTSTSGYHETVTVFWIKLLAAYLAKRSSARATFAHDAVREFGENRTIYRDFYSYDVIASTEARLAWRPPDLRPIA